MGGKGREKERGGGAQVMSDSRTPLALSMEGDNCAVLSNWSITVASAIVIWC